jgi:hypothetical protein
VRKNVERILLGVLMEPVPTKKPAVPKKISELRAGDERVRIVGLVLDRGDSELVLDDGSGQLTVIFDDPALVEGIEVSSRVRVFGSPMEIEGGLELRADLIQRADTLDLKLYEEVRREWKKLEAETRGSE